jgi:hypothetical protein
MENSKLDLAKSLIGSEKYSYEQVVDLLDLNWYETQVLGNYCRNKLMEDLWK